MADDGSYGVRAWGLSYSPAIPGPSTTTRPPLLLPDSGVLAALRAAYMLLRPGDFQRRADLLHRPGEGTLRQTTPSPGARAKTRPETTGTRWLHRIGADAAGTFYTILMISTWPHYKSTWTQRKQRSGTVSLDTPWSATFPHHSKKQSRTCNQIDQCSHPWQRVTQDESLLAGAWPKSRPWADPQSGRCCQHRCAAGVTVFLREATTPDPSDMSPHRPR